MSNIQTFNDYQMNFEFLEAKTHRFRVSKKRGGFVVIRTYPKGSKILSPLFFPPGVYYGELFPLPFVCNPFVIDRVVNPFGFPLSIKLSLPDLASYVRNLRSAGTPPPNDWFNRYGLRPNLDVPIFDSDGTPTGDYLKRYGPDDRQALFPRGIPAGPSGWSNSDNDLDGHEFAVPPLVPEVPAAQSSKLYTVEEVQDCDFVDVEPQAPPSDTSSRRSSVLYRIASGRLGRDDPCFCGSAKKFKKCCLFAPDQDVLLHPANGKTASLELVLRLLQNIVAKRD